MSFRSSENLQRYEMVRYQLDNVININPANNQHQPKNGYKFTINDRSSFYDWYNAYFEVQFKLNQLGGGGGFTAAVADNTGAITVINGAHSLIEHLVIKSSGKIIYDTSNLHKVTFVKNLLEYSDDFGRSVAKNSFWYIDTSDDNRAVAAGTNTGFLTRRLLTATDKDVNVIIPLNRYSFFEELESRMLPPMQIQLEINLLKDSELIYKHADAANGRVIVNRFLLWVPKLIPKDTIYDKFISSYLKTSSWKYNREMYNVSGVTQNSGFFQISPSIDNVKHVFVYLQREKTNNMAHNPYLFDTYKLQVAANDGNVDRYLTTCRLEYGNGIYYPETEYDSESKVRIFNDLMSYAMRKNDYNTGTQLNLANYNSLYSVIYFNLEFQTEKVTRDPKQLIFRYKINANSGVDFNVHAIVLYEEDVVINKVGNELVIV